MRLLYRHLLYHCSWCYWQCFALKNNIFGRWKITGDRPTDLWTDRWTDTPSFRDALLHLKTSTAGLQHMRLLHRNSSCDVIWWIFNHENSHIRHSKKTHHRMLLMMMMMTMMMMMMMIMMMMMMMMMMMDLGTTC